MSSAPDTSNGVKVDNDTEKTGRTRAFPVWLGRLLSTLLFLVLWEIYGRQVNPILFSTPTRVLGAFRDMLVGGELLEALLSSMVPFFWGLLLAIVVGITLGVLLGRVRFADVALTHLVNALYAIPAVALVPIIILWFGLGVQAKIAFVFLISVFPILFNTMDGVRDISRQYVDVARAHGAQERDILRTVTLPSALPFIMSGFRQSSGRALIGLIVAELFTGLSGLGALIAINANRLQVARVMALAVLLGVMGMLLISGGTYLERKVAPWKDTERAW